MSKNKRLLSNAEETDETKISERYTTYVYWNGSTLIHKDIKQSNGRFKVGKKIGRTNLNSELPFLEQRICIHSEIIDGKVHEKIYSFWMCVEAISKHSALKQYNDIMIVEYDMKKPTEFEFLIIGNKYLFPIDFISKDDKDSAKSNCLKRFNEHGVKMIEIEKSL